MAITPYSNLLEIEWVQYYKVNGQDLRYRGVHQSERLEVDQWVLVYCCSSCSRVASTVGFVSTVSILQCILRAYIGGLVEIGKVCVLILGFSHFKLLVELLGQLITSICLQVGQMLGAVVNEFFCLEKKISLIAEELSCYILILIGVKHVA